MSVKLPKSVVDGLKIGLRLHKAGKGGKGLVDETIRMARQGVSKGRWPEWKIVKASAWFARHVADRRRMKDPRAWNKAPNYSPAYVAWALWGDDGSGAGRRWIDKKAKELRSQGVKASPRKNPASSGFIVRPGAGSWDIADANLNKIKRPGHAYRGMTETEYKATVGKNGQVISRGDYSHPSEGTVFAKHPADAEDYANFGRDDPRKTGKPNYLVEVSANELEMDRDGYLKTFDQKKSTPATRVWKMVALKGAVVAKPISRRKNRINRGKPRTQPYKYGVPEKYLKGLPDKVARQRAAEIIRRRELGIKTDLPLPGDRIARSKPMRGSKWTRMYKKQYGEGSGTTRAAVARDTGIPVAIINEVYKRGVGASRTAGRRPGATDSSWALARVHAFVMKVLHKKGPINQDPDLARKVMARKNPVIKAKGISDAQVRRLGEAYLEGKDTLSTRQGKQMARAAAEKVHREFEKVRKKVRVIFTERDPYPDFEALRADVRNNKRMYIYTGHSITPLWDEQTNWKARAVHDYDHVTEGAGFGLHGEFMAFRAAAKKAPQLADLYMSEIPLQAAAYYLKGGFPDGPQKVVSVTPELTRIVNQLGMRQNPRKRRNERRMKALALDAQTLGKFMPPEQVALHLGAAYGENAPIEEVVLASISSIGRKKARKNPRGRITEFPGTSIPDQRARLEKELQTYMSLAMDSEYYGEWDIYEYALKNAKRIKAKLRKLKGQERRPRKNPPFRTPPYMRRCVVHLVHDGYDKDAAFAICNSSMQKAGYLSSGEGELTQRELSSGKRKRKVDFGKKDQKWFDREYERILKNAL